MSRKKYAFKNLFSCSCSGVSCEIPVSRRVGEMKIVEAASRVSGRLIIRLISHVGHVVVMTVHTFGVVVVVIIIIIIIIINCKWVCTRWQWYYNTLQYNTILYNTQKTNTHSKQYIQKLQTQCTQNYKHKVSI
jgi:hypothetical protein